MNRPRFPFATAPASSSAFRRLAGVALLLPPILLATLLSSGAAPAAADDAPVPTTGQLVPFSEDVVLDTGDVDPDVAAGRYIVVLGEAPTATYSGGVDGFRAPADAWDGTTSESRAAVAYADFLTERQDAVADTAGVTIDERFTVTTNGFVSTLTSAQAATLAADPRVERLVPDDIVPLAEIELSTEFLGLEGPDGVWSRVGGVEDVGTGVVVGVIDTGIAPENPSFAGDPLASTPSDTTPYRDGEAIVYTKSDGGTFRGVCQSGVQFSADDCSTKLVGARYFVDGFSAARIGGTSVGEYLSPRDGEGHGSHTAGTAAGNVGVDAKGVVISGVTPQAKVAAYKACWSGPSPATSTDDGCATTDLLGAIEAATVDGVDVINYSIGGAPATTTNSVTDQAFMAAASTGIFVAAAAGNSGPTASTLDNASPWITTVGASTMPAPQATIVLGDGDAFLGATVTVPEDGVDGGLILSDRAARPGREQDALLCMEGSLDPEAVRGLVVVCDRGVTTRTSKSDAVAAAGGIGMILVNASPSSLDVDEHTVPTVHVDSDVRDAVRAYAATPGATVVFDPEVDGTLPTPVVPQVASFSSRGPVRADGSDLLKPDLVAPGTTILAAHGHAEGAEPTFGFSSGTSMASPHVAGLAAMYLSEHPQASPAEIKSSLMTTATPALTSDGDGETDPFAQGNGQVEPSSFLDAGLLYVNDADDWQSYLKSIGMGRTDAADVDASDLNLASIAVGGLAGSQTVTRTVTATGPGEYTAAISGLDGIEHTVEPDVLSFSEAGEEQSFTITLTRTTAALGTYATGALEWTSPGGDGHVVRSAIAVRPIVFDAPLDVAGSGSTGSVDIETRFGDDATVDLALSGLARGSRVNGSGEAGGESDLYALTVADGAELLRVDVDAVDDAGNLDLNLYERYADGSTVRVGSSVSVAADEQIVLDFPMPGNYLVEVVFTGPGSTETLGYTLKSYAISQRTADEPFSVTPTTISGSSGDSPVVTASWSDLPGGTYLGIVEYEGTRTGTMITIDAGTEPVEPGEADLTVSPTADEWLLHGKEIRVTADGLTPGATYEAVIDERSIVREGTASEDGTIDWLVSTADLDAPGAHEVTLLGPGISETQPFRTSPVTFSWAEPDVRAGFDGAPHVTVNAFFSGAGPVVFDIVDISGAVVTQATAIARTTLFQVRSPEIRLEPGTYTAVVASVFPNGERGARFDVPPFEVTASPASSIFLGEPEADGSVEVTTANLTGVPERGRAVYQRCDGDRVVALAVIAVGTTVETWNLAGVARMTVLDRTGREILGYEDDALCDLAPTDPTGQDIWTILSAGDKTDARTIDAQLGFRFDPTTEAFSLQAGENDPNDGDIFLGQNYDLDPNDGAIHRTDFTVAESTPTWLTLTYSEGQSSGEVFYSERLTIDPLTVDDLRPGAALILPGTPVVSGTARIGEVLSVDPGTWSPVDLAFSYQWLRDGDAIDGATAARYAVAAADGGHELSVIVTGTATNGATATVQSAAVRIPVAETGDGDGGGDGTGGDGGLAATGSAFAAAASITAASLLIIGLGVALIRRRSGSSSD